MAENYIVVRHSPDWLSYKVEDARAFCRTTNNYAVTGRALQRLGSGALFEHGAAQSEFDRGTYRPVTFPAYLSVANKHPCCFMAAGPLLGSPSFMADPRAALLQFSRALEGLRSPPGLEWMMAPLGALIDLVRAAAS